ncbi:MAG: AtpZ/AtpI family protein [Planctomycetota bacterium]
MTRDEDLFDDEYERRVGRQCGRMREARKTSGGSLWRYLGLIGMVGWSVAIPTALGAVLGGWLEATFALNDAWTFALVLCGLVVGCVNAWRAITRERT